MGNTVYVCSGAEHPALTTRGVLTGPFHWIAGAPPAALVPSASSAARLAPGESAAEGGSGLSCDVLQQRGAEGAAEGLAEGLAEGSVIHCKAQVRHLEAARECSVRIQKSQLRTAPHQPAFPSAEAGSALSVRFSSNVKHVAEEQILVLYDGDVCLGGGSIHEREK